jgi:hypothetical protein
MTKRKIVKPRSTRIDDFAPEQLEQLVDAYDEISTKLRDLRALTRVRLRPANDATQRLAALRGLDARGHLTIRITDGGNLSVRALLATTVGEKDVYAVLIRRPAKRG